jgi:hypothetical protein
MYTVHTETNTVDKNFVDCLSKGSGRLLILDRAAPHNGCWLSQILKSTDNVREGVFIHFNWGVSTMKTYGSVTHCNIT